MGYLQAREGLFGIATVALLRAMTAQRVAVIGRIGHDHVGR